MVEAAKVRDYLLSHEHSVGRFKAAFVEGLGYTVTDWVVTIWVILVGETAPRFVTAFPG